MGNWLGGGVDVVLHPLPRDRKSFCKSLVREVSLEMSSPVMIVEGLGQRDLLGVQRWNRSRARTLNLILSSLGYVQNIIFFAVYVLQVLVAIFFLYFLSKVCTFVLVFCMINEKEAPTEVLILLMSVLLPHIKLKRT
jgi:hypothetical protein